MTDRDTAPTVELLQPLIRNACVNDGRPDSGEEMRNADVLQTLPRRRRPRRGRFDAASGAHVDRRPHRGLRPVAPALCLMGHTDVVPVNPDGWSRDPFGGELSPIRGRPRCGAAAPSTCSTSPSSMAVAFRRLADEGFRPRGTLIYFGVADEEAGGEWGAAYMAEHHWDADRRRLRAHRDRRVVAGRPRRRAPHRRQRGREGHRLAAPAHPRHAGPRVDAVRLRQRPRQGGGGRAPPRGLSAGTAARRSVDGPGSRRWASPTTCAPRCVDPARIDDAIASLDAAAAPASPTPAPTPPSRRTSSTAARRRTSSPTSSTSTSTSAPCPARRSADVERHLAAALGDLARASTSAPLQDRRPTRSATGNPLWDVLAARTQAAYPGADLLPGHHRRRHRRPLLPRARARSPTAPRCSRRR